MTRAEFEVLWLSVQVALAAVALSLPLAIAVGHVLSRRRFGGKILVEALVHAPLVVPPVVTGYLLLVVFGRRGMVGAWIFDTFGWSLSFDWRGAALASAVVAFPLAVRSIRLSFDAIDARLEDAARTLGATDARVFWRVSLPLAAPGVITGALLAFARSVGEFGATITFVGNIQGSTRTLPLAIYSALQTPGGDGAAFRLVMVSLGVSFLALVAAEFFARRSKQ